MKRFMTHLLLVVIFSVFALVLTGCGGGGGGSSGGSGATLISIAVTPINPSIAVSTLQQFTTQQFTATGIYSDHTTQNLTTSVTWSSSNPPVATISNTVGSKGFATLVNYGVVSITATSGSVSGSTTLTVSAVFLPQTGQKTSYAAGDDGNLQKGIVWPSPRFTVGTGAGTDCVTDNLTGLMWAKDANLSNSTKTWQEALDYMASMNSGGGLCGYNDWRLPNRKELRSLINYGQNDPATWLNTQGFNNVQEDFYWTSTTSADDTTYAWFVSMLVGAIGAPGYVDTDDKTSSSYVWPVRAGQSGGVISLPQTGQKTSYATGDDGDFQRGVVWPNARFTVGTGAGADCVTDKLTGLMWIKAPEDILRTWSEALDYANGLSLCGYTDWRVPNVDELESLVNVQQADLVTWLNTQGFSNVQEDFYWTSTTSADDTAYAWFVSMWIGATGYVDNDDKTNIYYVWPVRAWQ